MTGVNDANANLTFTYDSGGRQITAATSGTAGQPSVTLTSGYDAFGNRASLYDSLSNTGRTTYSYDAAFRLTTIARDFFDKATTTTISGPQVVYGYDNANRLTSESRTIGGTGTAVATSFSYDNANRLTTLTHQVTGGSALATILYGYDNGNRVTSERNAEGTVTYGYDAANELTGASGSRAETYTYDSGGNRTMAGYSTGSGNELTASPGATYTYDNEGNMTAQANTSTHVVTSYTYDYYNRLTGVTVGGTAVATYVYDALGRRIGFNDNGTQTWTVYDGVNGYADFNGAGTLLERYLYGPAVDALLARTSSGGTTAWYLTDRLGTVRDIASTSGTVIDHLSYDSFGNVLSESNSGNGDRFKFTGREFDATTGQYYYRARWYGPTVGKFINQDPKGMTAGDANLYRYVGNDTTNSTDSLGLEEDSNSSQYKSNYVTKKYQADIFWNTQMQAFQNDAKNRDCYEQGCVGLAKLRMGLGYQDLIEQSTRVRIFDNEEHLRKYIAKNELKQFQIFAIQYNNVNTIKYTDKEAGMLDSMDARAKARQVNSKDKSDWNYATWYSKGTQSYWEWMDHAYRGGLAPTVTHSGTLPDYDTTLYGIYIKDQDYEKYWYFHVFT